MAAGGAGQVGAGGLGSFRDHVRIPFLPLPGCIRKSRLRGPGPLSLFLLCDTRIIKPTLLVICMRGNVNRACWVVCRTGLLLGSRCYMISSQHRAEHLVGIERMVVTLATVNRLFPFFSGWASINASWKRGGLRGPWRGVGHRGSELSFNPRA